MFLVMCYLKKKGNGKQGKDHRFAPARWACYGRYKHASKAQHLRDMFITQGVNCTIIESNTAQQARAILSGGAI